MQRRKLENANLPPTSPAPFSRNYLLRQGSCGLIIAAEETALICINFHRLEPAQGGPAGIGWVSLPASVLPGESNTALQAASPPPPALLPSANHSVPGPPRGTCGDPVTCSPVLRTPDTLRASPPAPHSSSGCGRGLGPQAQDLVFNVACLKSSIHTW